MFFVKTQDIYDILKILYFVHVLLSSMQCRSHVSKDFQPRHVKSRTISGGWIHCTGQLRTRYMHKCRMDSRTKVSSFIQTEGPIFNFKQNQTKFYAHSCEHWAETYMLGRTLDGCIFLLLHFTDTARMRALFERNSSDCSSLCEFLDMTITDLQ